MKKNILNFKKWIWIGAIPTALGTILLFSKTITIYAEMPEKIQKIEEYIDAQQQSNEIQQKANELMQQILIQKEKQTNIPIVSKDGKWFWNEAKKEWRPIKELQKNKVE